MEWKKQPTSTTLKQRIQKLHRINWKAQNRHLIMSKTLGLDLASKRQRTRNDYTYREDYRTRWYLTHKT